MGSWAAGTLGKDMNKRTVLRSKHEESSQTPQAGDPTSIIKGPFEKGCSYYYGTFEVVVTHTHVQAHMYLRRHVVNACSEMHRPVLYRQTHPFMSQIQHKSLICPSKLQQTKWKVAYQRPLPWRDIEKGSFRTVKSYLIQMLLLFRKCCLVCLKINLSLEPSAHLALIASSDRLNCV